MSSPRCKSFGSDFIYPSLPFLTQHSTLVSPPFPALLMSSGALPEDASSAVTSSSLLLQHILEVVPHDPLGFLR